MIIFFFFFNDTATTEIYTLSLHDALPISRLRPDARALDARARAARVEAAAARARARGSGAVGCARSGLECARRRGDRWRRARDPLHHAAHAAVAPVPRALRLPAESGRRALARARGG